MFLFSFIVTVGEGLFLGFYGVGILNCVFIVHILLPLDHDFVIGSLL